MFYEVHLKIRKKNEKRELSYFEAWRIECRSFLPYQKPVLGVVFKQEWPHTAPPPDPNDVYMVLVEAKTSSSKDEAEAFTKGRSLIREYLNQQNTPTFLVYTKENSSEDS
jgi:hypothetical protein